MPWSSIPVIHPIAVDLAILQRDILADPGQLRLGDEEGVLHIVIVAEAGEPAGEDAQSGDEGDRDDGKGDQDLDQGEAALPARSIMPRHPSGQPIDDDGSGERLMLQPDRAAAGGPIGIEAKPGCRVVGADRGRAEGHPGDHLGQRMGAGRLEVRNSRVSGSRASSVVTLSRMACSCNPWRVAAMSSAAARSCSPGMPARI